MSSLLFAIRASIVVVFAGLLVGVVWRRRSVLVALDEFLFAPTSAVNLALFRIVAFGLLIFESMINQGTAVWFSALPPELRVAPPGLSHWMPLLAIDPSLVSALQTSFLLCCVLALLGLFTRWAAPLAVVLGLFVLGVPQLFGKLNHYHHVLWFAAIVAASPSHRALSLDVIRRGTEAGPARWVGDTEERSCYGLPLRLCWLVVGLIYFFPGLWKAWEVGDVWVAGDNVQLLLREKWLELADFQPLIWLDRYPVLYRATGAFTILFELGFVFALFFPRVRPWAVLSGLAFHSSTKLIMDISFVSLVLAYVMFLDVPRVWRWLAGFWGQRSGSAASARAFLAPQAPRTRENTTAAAAVGGTVLASMLVCGFAGIDTWPVAVYPRFHYTPRARMDVLVLEVQAADGKARSLLAPSFITKLHSSRWVALTRHIGRTRPDAERRRRLQALVRAIQGNGAELHRGERVHVYVDRVSTAPDQRQSNPLQRWEMDVIDVESGS